MDKKIVIMKNQVEKIILMAGIMIFGLSVKLYSQCATCVGTDYLSSIGEGNQVLGTCTDGATAIGYQSQVGAKTSVAIGYQSSSNANYSTAIGYQSSANASFSTAMGTLCTANGTHSVAIGLRATSYVEKSFTFGRNVRGNASNSITIGCSENDYELVNDKLNSLMIGFNSIKPTLFVGPSPTVVGFNATGNVGIATSEPLQPMHVNGNVLITGRNASLLFADDPPTNGNWGKWGIEYETDGLNFWKPFENDAASGNYDPKGGTQNHVLFLKDNGYIGVGTNDPLARFHIEGGSSFLNCNLQVGSNKEEKLTRLYGKVGIGTDNPLATLQVNGSVSIGYDAYPAPETNNLIVNGQVGIGTFTPSVPLEVVGKIKTSQIQLTTGYMNGYILKSDENGNAYWANPSTIDDGDWICNGNNITVDGSKMIGIGTSTPVEALDVNGNMRCSGNIAGARTSWLPFKIFANSSETDGSYISLSNNSTNAGSVKFYSTGENGRIEFHNQNLQVMSIRGDNNVYFGNPETATNLYVNGEITASLVRVNTQEWWDRVFDEGYRLPSLSEVEAYVKEHKHLPGIPAEADVKANGIDLAQMNAMLLKKVEELTLYVIELEKKIEEKNK